MMQPKRTSTGFALMEVVFAMGLASAFLAATLSLRYQAIRRATGSHEALVSAMNLRSAAETADMCSLKPTACQHAELARWKRQETPEGCTISAAEGGASLPVLKCR